MDGQKEGQTDKRMDRPTQQGVQSRVLDLKVVPGYPLFIF